MAALRNVKSLAEAFIIAFAVIVHALAAAVEKIAHRVFTRRARRCGACQHWVITEPREGICARSGEVIDSASACTFERIKAMKDDEDGLS